MVLRQKKNILKGSIFVDFGIRKLVIYTILMTCKFVGLGIQGNKNGTPQKLMCLQYAKDGVKRRY